MGGRPAPFCPTGPPLEVYPLAPEALITTEGPPSPTTTAATASETRLGPTTAASAMTALHSPAPMVPSQHSGTAQPQANGAPRTQPQEPQAILHLIPMNGTFERKTINVPFYPDVLRIGRQTNNKTIPTPLNGYFDSKVLSRQHAEIWADRQWDMPLTCRVLFFMLKTHHKQIVASRTMRSMLDDIRQNLRSALQEQKDIMIP